MEVGFVKMSSGNLYQMYRKLATCLFKRVPSDTPVIRNNTYYALPPLESNFNLNPIWSYLNGALPAQLEGDDEFYEWMSILELYDKLKFLYKSRSEFGRDFLECASQGPGIEFGLFLYPGDSQITLSALCLRCCPLISLSLVQEQIDEGVPHEDFRTQVMILLQDPCTFHYDQQESLIPVELGKLEMGARDKVEKLSEEEALKVLDPKNFHDRVFDFFGFKSWRPKEKA